jgi:hypothetical protein
MEILGSHYTDIYFNHIWTSARAQAKRGGALTDEYTRQVKAYIIGAKTDKESYRGIVEHLHTYFRTTTRYSALPYNEFVNQVVAQFIPPEYFALLRAEEKDEALGTIVADLISGLGVYVTSPALLQRVVANHDERPAETIRQLQDQAVTLLLAKRAEIHNKFLRKVGQAKEGGLSETEEALKGVIRKLVSSKVGLKAELGDAEERARAAEASLRSAKRREAKLRKLVELLDQERRGGVVEAAFQARLPRANREGEVGDPLEPGGAPPRPNHHGEAGPGPSRGAPGAGARGAPGPPLAEAGFFTEFDPLEVPLAAVSEKPRRPAPPARRRRAAASTQTAGTCEDSSGGSASEAP